MKQIVTTKWPEYLTLTAYTALVAFTIPHYEPWADEAQAWQLARTIALLAKAEEGPSEARPPL